MLSINPLAPTPASAHELPAAELRGFDDGFSLLELLVALAIFAFAIAIVAPNFRQSTGSDNLRLVSFRIASDLQAARATAIMERRPVSFIADAKSRSFGV